MTELDSQLLEFAEKVEKAQDAARVAIEHLDPKHITSYQDLREQLEFCLEHVEMLMHPLPPIDRLG